MKYLKTSVSIPEKAYEKLKKTGNISEKVEEIALSYINKPLEFKPLENPKQLLISISYDTVKKIREKRKITVKEFIQYAVKKWLEEETDGRN